MTDYSRSPIHSWVNYSPAIAQQHCGLMECSHIYGYVNVDMVQKREAAHLCGEHDGKEVKYTLAELGVMCSILL